MSNQYNITIVVVIAIVFRLTFFAASSTLIGTLKKADFEFLLGFNMDLFGMAISLN